MSNKISSKPRPRVLFFGMQGNFSPPPLHALLEHGIEVCAVVLPAEHIPGRELAAISRREQPRTARTMLPLLQSDLYSSILQPAWKRQIPVWEVQRLSDPETVSTLAAYAPDAICVACFSQRIPRVILDLPRLGCLNVHPALLPANRGPVPLFWTFREGHRQTGVTIHLMNEGMDTGDVLAQEAIEVPDGIRYTELESQCAALGGKLLAQTVWDLYRDNIARIPQDETKSSYRPFQSREDFVVEAPLWSARHVYNFICGVANWNGPVIIKTDQEELTVQEAISYSLENAIDSSNERLDTTDQEGWVHCKDGWVKVKAAATGSY